MTAGPVDSGSASGRSNGGDSAGDNSDGAGGPDGYGNGSDQVSTAEMVVMVLSVAFAVALFGFAFWQVLTGPGAATPSVAVVGNQPGPDGGVVYTVEARNRGDAGLVSLTVEAGCTQPPAEIVFENVPADGRRTGTVVCPPGTSDPAVSVSTWVEE